MDTRDLSGQTIYRAGRGIEETARELGVDPAELIKLSSNENALGPSPKAVDAIREHAETLHSYPKASHADLGDALAERWDVDPAQIWLANGGDGAMDYLARAMLEPGDAVLVPDPDFTYHAMSVRYHHGEVHTYPLAEDDGFAQSPDRVLAAYDGERMVYLTSPHNPTGSTVSLDEIEAIAERTGEETLVVVDEAYGEFNDAPSAVELLENRDDVAVVRTFSKAYGLAGLRLGYAITPRAWADAYDRINTPFAASEIACRAGLAALEDDEHVEAITDLVEWSREYYHDELDAKTYESGGNFVLVAVGDASRVAQESKERGVIVRDCSSFGLPEHIRVTCGTREETKRAVETINEVC
ncbi:Histidinol-phosphate aminotransferase protein [Halorhabdus tiamatea SARL4B]|uniref:Histidinol-phosphate aminotransferase n=1 Tax=Halorhabdus tiamatea SARL4B TaxID=1033806 RepID=F7PMU9_9EURY|nr:histidinol-phosphate transaminase [Halorhabdus tiamatea]ERJ07657.1 Histidinol-phosphate aminotransferase protein [Halorhabdus tiamatea SARL4B]CCQ32687.1 histidinol-phosphate aminotransferase [Halorhabdus tiamatea SARL4B]